MFSSLDTPCRIRHSNKLFLAMLVLSVAVCAQAQAPGSSRGLASGDGSHTIQGRVFFPAGQASTGISVKVNLESTNGEGAYTTTEQDSAVRLNSVRQRDYSE